MIFGHYLAVQPWTPDFNPKSFTVKQVVGWVRLPCLPTRYYCRNVVKEIGSILGEVIRVDYHTESAERGRFARIAVVLDLSQPLVPKIQVDDHLIYVEYEGLPLICFHCGRYGHQKDNCPENPARVTATPVVPPAPANAPASTSAVPHDEPQFGDWMLVPMKPRQPDKGVKKTKSQNSKDKSL